MSSLIVSCSLREGVEDETDALPSGRRTKSHHFPGHADSWALQCTRISIMDDCFEMAVGVCCYNLLQWHENGVAESSSTRIYMVMYNDIILRM